MRIAVAVLGLLLMTSVCAQGLRYRVEVDAPRDLARTLRQGLSLVRWQKDPQMSAEQLRRIAKESEREAREVAATEGYFSATVETRIEETEPEWKVTLKLEPGERTRVASVDIRFSGPATQDGEARKLFDRVRSRWLLRPGEPFRQADWDQAKRGALRDLSRWRYAAPRIADSKAAIDPATHEAKLEIELASGPAFRFGAVRVTGLKRYADSVAENLSPIRAGDTYDRDVVLAYQRRLLESGYFASVQADLDTHPLLADAAPLRVAVIEAASQDVETGISYTTDAGPRFELRYGNQDIFDSAWRHKTSLRVDQKEQILQLDFDSPPKPEAHWNNFFTRAKRTDIQNEITEELAVGAAHKFYAGFAPVALIGSMHFEQQILVDRLDYRQALYLGFRRSFQRTDDLVLPRLGYIGTAEIGGGVPQISTERFLRVVANASLLYPVSRAGDLLLRAQAGVVFAETREGIPSTFLFRTGGDQTVRGYAFESLGVQQGDATVGGRRLLLGSIEYTHWIGDNWGPAAFIDAGNAWDSGATFNPALGYGLGVRFRTPIGPIRADIAYGEETNQYRLHFSIGYTF
ncbi:MAG TPA: autotransporter assembly complex family protein [Burkholderiales bacterium]|nr:autotransporter assembly complex family protein [Burkholderiales bacterium]